ncbi:hypothetical protein AB0H83_34330 [Dactylosporangium sp. NPDC050688]|uniref:hypothetical protein n=1 Tax=Dactylosporangium sp. NPDC050688 TaxID=3157217 RepID=UPI0033D22324
MEIAWHRESTAKHWRRRLRGGLAAAVTVLIGGALAVGGDSPVTANSFSPK